MSPGFGPAGMVTSESNSPSRRRVSTEGLIGLSWDKHVALAKRPVTSNKEDIHSLGTEAPQRAEGPQQCHRSHSVKPVSLQTHHFPGR